MTNKELFTRITDEVMNRGNRGLFDELVSPQLITIFTDSEKQRTAAALWSEWIAPARAAFPDLKVKVEDTVSEGELTAVRWSATGTHLGPLFGRAPTEKRINTFGLHFGRVKDGRITELWVKFSRLQMLTQLGF
ncbi:MAG: ester cyclase [Archangiaceae bacterium]|nr:ester cyclase [Archangiaceae bacterium]